METFQYHGRNRRGEALHGSVESANAQAVAQWLMETDIFPIAIVSQNDNIKEENWLETLRRNVAISPQDVLMFTRQMGIMVRSGLPMMDAIAGIRRSTTSKPLARVLQSIREDLDRGLDLSTALSRHPKVFNDYYVSMIQVGESSGRLHEAFNSLYQQIEFDRQMRQKIKSALRYPSFVMIAIAVAIAILTIFVIPVFAKTYSGMHVQLPLLTRVLLSISGFTVRYWWMLLGGLGLLSYGFAFFLKSYEGRYAWDRFKLRVPIIGKVLARATIARFCRSFATASQSGVPLVLAFQLCSRVVDNAYYEERILQMRQGVERGEILSRVMRLSGIFTPLELQMIAVAEATGEVDNAIEQLALVYQDEVEYDVASLSQTIEPLLLVVMGVLVGGLLLGIFMPMWELGQATFKAHR